MFFLGHTELASHTHLRSVLIRIAVPLPASSPRRDQNTQNSSSFCAIMQDSGRLTFRMVEGAARPARNLAARRRPRSSSSLAHMAQASPSASMVAPLQSRQWRLSGSQKRPGHHRRLLGDLFSERKRLEIRMMGENISDRVGDIERNPHSGSRVKFEQTYSRPRHQSSHSALTLAADFPSPLRTLAAFAHPFSHQQAPLPQFEPLWPPSFHSMNSIFPGTSRCSGKSGNKIGFPSRTKVATSRSSVAI